MHFEPSSLKRTMKQAGFDVIHYQSMYFPLEGVASLGISIARAINTPPKGSPLSWRSPIDATVSVILFLLFPLMEIPSQIILRLLNLSGHHTIIGRPSPGAPSAP